MANSWLKRGQSHCLGVMLSHLCLNIEVYMCCLADQTNNLNSVSTSSSLITLKIFVSVFAFKMRLNSADINLSFAQTTQVALAIRLMTNALFHGSDVGHSLHRLSMEDRAGNIISDPFRPGNHPFDPLPSGQCYRSHKTRASRQQSL